jgi:phage gp46-like protein
MTDIAILPDGYFAPFDIYISESGFEADDSLETAVIISLFTDRRLPESLALVENSDRKGYWGDLAESDGYQWGSLLWTMYRQVITDTVITSCRQFAEESLQWMIDDRIAESVTVTAERAGTYQINIGIDIVKRDTRDTLRYSYLWDGQSKRMDRQNENIDILESLQAMNDWYACMNYTVPELLTA